ncbi:TadE/TadG family type IV pilus assembly protein [Bacterioplanoides sp.]|uniref:TadE/TadG family type IV pilus assembly protein n=1 Tax=Bacterioplanoides sp. TaxID=2066072 RepID=UPI003B008EC1
MKSRFSTGTVTIEMAFALPIFLLFILFSVESARFFWTQHWLNYNLHHAAQLEALDPQDGVQQRLTRQLTRAGVLVAANAVRVYETEVSWFNNANGPLTRYRAEAELDFLLFRNSDADRTLTLSSTTWLGETENEIN